MMQSAQDDNTETTVTSATSARAIASDDSLAPASATSLMTSLVLLLVVAVASLVVLRGRRARRHRERSVHGAGADDAAVTNIPPGNLGLPLVGEMLSFLVEAPSGEFFTKRERQHGPIFKTHILGRPTVFVSGAAGVRRVLTGEHSLVENAWPAPMRWLMGVGALATSTGDEHRHRRRCVMACLGRERVRRYAPRLRQVIRDEIRRWVNNDGQPIDVYAAAKRMTTRAAAWVLLGIELDRKDKENDNVHHQQQKKDEKEDTEDGKDGGNVMMEPLDNEEAGLRESIEKDLGDYADGFFTLPLPIPGTAFYRALRAKSRLHRNLGKLLQQKQQQCVNNLSSASPSSSPAAAAAGDDIISELFASSTDSSSPHEAAVIDQALELLFGGQETLSCLVTCIVMLLAADHRGQASPATDRVTAGDDRQPVLEKIFEETSGQVEESGDEEADLVGVARQMDYVSAVVKETLRLYPPIGGGYRRALRSFDVDGYRVPCGWSVTYGIKSTHDASPLFADRTEDFVPERWFSVADKFHRRAADGDENASAAPSTSFNYLPFGAGARACVGREYATLFARLFCVELARTCAGWRLVMTSLPVEFLRVPVVRPKAPMYAIFTPRESDATGTDKDTDKVEG